MGIFDFFKHTDINQGVVRYKNTPNAVLVDVRTPEEFLEGRIPGSKNIPLDSIDKADSLIVYKDTPLFVYCYSGLRSARAVSFLKRMGYSSVTDIGGISSYNGKVEK